MESLLAQTFQDWDAILVDDGPGQLELTAIIEAAAASDPRIRALPLSPNGGVSAARNHALKEARGEHLIFLDSDDLFLPWTLRVYDEVITREERPAIVVGRAALLSADDSHAVAENGQITLEKHADYLTYRAAVEHWWFNPSGAVMHADEIRKISGFWQSRELCEDIDIWQRLGTAPGFVQVMEPRTYAYRLHDGGAHHGYNTLPWNLRLGRWKFPTGFSLVAAARLFKR